MLLFIDGLVLLILKILLCPQCSFSLRIVKHRKKVYLKCSCSWEAVKGEKVVKVRLVFIRPMSMTNVVLLV